MRRRFVGTVIGPNRHPGNQTYGEAYRFVCAR
jgi:hypothetical protein